MNMLDVQDKLKGLSEQQLVQEMQMPSGSAPQFLVLSEITRRKRMRDSVQQQPDNTTVAQEAVAAAGVPQGGIADMAQALAPKTDMTQNTGVSPVQGMYGGGYVQKMQAGAFVDSKSLVPYSQQNFPSALASDPAVIAMAQRLGIPVEEYIASLSPDTRAKNLQRVVDGRITQLRRTDVFDPTVPALSQVAIGAGEFRPYSSAITPNDLVPTQADLDARYRSSMAEEPRFVGVPLAPESGGTGPSVLNLASPPQSLYPPVPVGNPIPGEEPSYYTPPERAEPLSPMERIRSLQGPSFEGEGRGDVFDAREPETQLAYDWQGSGEFIEVPTLGQQVENIGEQVSSLPGAVADYFRDIELPYVGDPYSELSSQEVGDLSSGRMSPDTAKALQAGRLSMLKYGGRGSAPASAQSTSSPTPEPDAEKTPAPGGETPPAPAADDLIADITTGGTRTSGGAGGVGSASGATSYEQELINAMQRAERRAQQDKWLALAQVGLGLMSSTQPTLGGALGEAGIAGLQSYQGARDEYETERLGLSKELAGIEAARASQRAAASKASSGPTLQQLIDARDALFTKSTNEFGESVVAPMQGAEGEIAQINAAIRSKVGSIAAPTM
jgi:hypothetical protein